MHILDLRLYSLPKELWGNGVRTHVISKGKIPSKKFSSEQDGIHDAASSRTASPTHCQLSNTGPTSDFNIGALAALVL